MQKIQRTVYLTDDIYGPGIHINPVSGLIQYTSSVCGSFVSVPVNRERATTILKTMRKCGEVFCTREYMCTAVDFAKCGSVTAG